MRGEVLHGGDDMPFATEGGVALEAPDGGHAELGDEVGIFAEGLLDAAPARLAGDVDDGGEGLMGAAQTGFPGGHGVERFDEFGMEGCGQADGLGKAGCVHGGLAVEALFVEDDGDAEAALFEEEALDGVGEFGGGAGVEARAGIAGASDLTQAMALFKGSFGFLLVEAALRVHEGFGLFLPDAYHLGGFLGEGHPGQEVFGALFRGELWVLVEGRAD